MNLPSTRTTPHILIKYLTLLLFILLPFLGFYVGVEFQKKRSVPVVPAIRVFSSQTECEATTNFECGFQNCDYIPPGKTFSQVCGKNFKKGWVASKRPISNLTPTPNLSRWPAYTDTHIGYTFQYPSIWGPGANCDGDVAEHRHRFGEHLLKFPLADCGTGKIPSPIMFYTVSSYSPKSQLVIKEQHPITVDGISATYYTYQNIHEQRVLIEFNQVVIPLPNKQLLIAETSDIKHQPIFDQILFTLRFTNETSALPHWKQSVTNCIEDVNSFLWPLMSQIDKNNQETTPLTSTITLTDTSRGCISLPEDIFPRSSREFISNNASMGYLSNWEEACGGISVVPTTSPNPKGACTGDGYEVSSHSQNGSVRFKAKSINPAVPDIDIQFVVTKPS